MFEFIKRKNIRQVLGLAYLVAIFLMAVFVALVASNQVIAHLEEHELAQAHSLAERLAKDSRIALIQMAAENILPTVKMVTDLPSIKSVSIYEKSGYILVGEDEPIVSFNDISTYYQEDTSGNESAHLLKETYDYFYIVTPVYIESTYGDEKQSFGETVELGSRSLLGYVLLNVDKSELHAARNKVLRETLFIMTVIATLFLLAIMNVLGRITTPLRNLAELMTHPDTAKTYRKAVVYGVKEVWEISTAFNDLMDSLENVNKELLVANEALEKRVLERTKDLKSARDKARKLNNENRSLIRGMNSTLEEERKYIARELHDHLNADLLFIKLSLRRIKTGCEQVQAEGAAGELQKEVKGTMDHLIDKITDIYDSSRNIVRMLRPEVIDSLGLVGAIEDRIDMFRTAQPECKFTFNHSGDYSDLHPDSQMAIFRIIQESLTNTGKHAEATNVIIRLCRECEESPDGILVLVNDNGIGFNVDEINSKGIGLISMRERAFSLGGSLTVDSRPGEGTTIIATFPLGDILLEGK